MLIIHKGPHEIPGIELTLRCQLHINDGFQFNLKDVDGALTFN